MAAKTNLMQIAVRYPADSVAKFDQNQSANVPIVAVPDNRWCCSAYMNVPTGPYCIQHRWGKDAHPSTKANPEGGLAAQGLQVTPACNRIAYCVSALTQTYNAPVKSCPTADNVMVDCDLTLVFKIGPKAVDVKKFVYLLGARRFDEFLYAAVEESIRHLIRSCMHTEVYELRGQSDDRVRSTLHELNKKFNNFGVTFDSVAITEVRFKDELQRTLQSTTEYKSKMEEQDKKQKHLMDEVQYRQTRELGELDKSNERVIQDLRAHRARVEIDREKRRTAAEGQAEVAIVRAQQEASVVQVRAASEKEVAKTRGLKAKEEVVADAKAADIAARIKVEQEAKTMIYESEQRLLAAKDKAQAVMIEAEAEERAAPQLKARREHDLELAKMEVLQAIAANSQMVISGENGDRLINAMLSDSMLTGKIELLQ